MTITLITVAAERCFNHPYESYSNLRPRVEFVATLCEGDDPDKCTRELQAKAETAIEQHKALMLEQIEHLQRSSQVQSELARMEEAMRRAQERWDELAKKAKDLGMQVPTVQLRLGINEEEQADTAQS